MTLEPKKSHNEFTITTEAPVLGREDNAEELSTVPVLKNRYLCALLLHHSNLASAMPIGAALINKKQQNKRLSHCFVFVGNNW